MQAWQNTDLTAGKATPSKGEMTSKQTNKQTAALERFLDFRSKGQKWPWEVELAFDVGIQKDSAQKVAFFHVLMLFEPGECLFSGRWHSQTMIDLSFLPKGGPIIYTLFRPL